MQAVVTQGGLRLELVPLLVQQADALVQNVQVLRLHPAAQLPLPRLQPLTLVLRVVEGRGDVLGKGK